MFFFIFSTCGFYLPSLFPHILSDFKFIKYMNQDLVKSTVFMIRSDQANSGLGIGGQNMFGFGKNPITM